MDFDALPEMSDDSEDDNARDFASANDIDAYSQLAKGSLEGLGYDPLTVLRFSQHTIRAGQYLLWHCSVAQA